MSESVSKRSKLRRQLKDLIEDPQLNDEQITQQALEQLQGDNQSKVVPDHITDSRDSNKLYSIGICYDHNLDRWHCFTMQTQNDRVNEFRLFKPNTPSYRRLRALPQLVNVLAYKVFRR